MHGVVQSVPGDDLHGQHLRAFKRVAGDGMFRGRLQRQRAMLGVYAEHDAVQAGSRQSARDMQRDGAMAG